RSERPRTKRARTVHRSTSGTRVGAYTVGPPGRASRGASTARFRHRFGAAPREPQACRAELRLLPILGRVGRQKSEPIRTMSRSGDLLVRENVFSRLAIGLARREPRRREL